MIFIKSCLRFAGSFFLIQLDSLNGEVRCVFYELRPCSDVKAKLKLQHVVVSFLRVACDVLCPDVLLELPCATQQGKSNSAESRIADSGNGAARQLFSFRHLFECELHP